MFNLPEKLTPQSLAALVQDRRYRDRRDPEHKAYRDFVSRAYRSFYGEAGGGVDRGAARAGGGIVHVRGYTRVVDGKLQHVQAYERRGPWSDRPVAEFRQAIAKSEQSADKKNDGYGEVGKGPISRRALGRYQLQRDALVDAGWRDKRDGSWTLKARTHGVKNDKDFLKSPKAQEDAFDDYLQAIESLAAKEGLFSHVGEKIAGRDGAIVVADAGIMAAAHRQGVRKTAHYFRELGGSPVEKPLTEGERNSIATRLREFQDVPYRRMSQPRATQPLGNGKVKAR